MQKFIDRNEYYMIFSVSGYTEKLKEIASKRKDVVLG